MPSNPIATSQAIADKFAARSAARHAAMDAAAKAQCADPRDVAARNTTGHLGSYVAKWQAEGLHPEYAAAVHQRIEAELREAFQRIISEAVGSMPHIVVVHREGAVEDYTVTRWNRIEA